jgi:integrase
MVLSHLHGIHHLLASLLYGSGLRLSECLRLRVKDLYRQITVRDGKGEVDRKTMLPESTIEPLKRQLEHARWLHQQDLSEGFGAVYLPYALERKYPKANRQWGWQYVFPAERRSRDPRSGEIRRHHLLEDSLQRAVKQAIQQAKITKHSSCHTFRYSFATHLLEDGYEMMTTSRFANVRCRSCWATRMSRQR